MRGRKKRKAGQAAPGHLRETQGQPEMQQWRPEPAKSQEIQPGEEIVRRDRERVKEEGE